MAMKTNLNDVLVLVECAAHGGEVTLSPGMKAAHARLHRAGLLDREPSAKRLYRLSSRGEWAVKELIYRLDGIKAAIAP